MNQDKLLPLMMVIAIVIVIIRATGWAKFARQKSEADEQAAKARAAFASGGGPTATVTAYRLNTFVGKRNLYYLNCDGVPVIGLRNGTFASFPVPAGEHSFTMPGTALQPIKVTLDAGATLHIRFGFESLARLAFEVVPEARARNEMTDLTPAQG